jgi:hypothetical protein
VPSVHSLLASAGGRCAVDGMVDAVYATKAGVVLDREWYDTRRCAPDCERWGRVVRSTVPCAIDGGMKEWWAAWLYPAANEQ